MTFLKALCMAILAELVPIHQMLITVLVLILVDTCTGVWAAIKRKEKITSAGFRRAITKTFIYMLALICGWICQKYLLLDTVPVSSLIASAIGIVEMKSILENADGVVGGSLFKSLIKKLGSVNDKKDPS